MIRLIRPPSPIEEDGEVKRCRERVSAAITVGVPPEFVGAWRDDRWRLLLHDAQRQRCAWCGGSIINQHSHVDHIAPKSSWSRLLSVGVDSGRGVAKRGTRKTEMLSTTGFWWLAYTWDNWVMSCQLCNEWKSDLYPVAEHDPGVPDPARPLTPLLLDPYRDDPDEHLDYDELGEVFGRTARGRATIDTCGLHRQTLAGERREFAEQAFLLVCRLRRAEEVADPDEEDRVVRQCLEDLYRLGRDGSLFAGVVRGILRRELADLDFGWADVVALHDPLTTTRTPG